MSISHAEQSLFAPIATVFGAVLLAVPTAAQGTEESATRITEEIIVTAERREENVLKVPMSMTVLNDTKIDELGIQNAMDLEQLVPGLQFGDPTEGLGHGTTMRGMGTARGGDKAGVDISRDEAVATYVDGVFTFAEYGLDAHLSTWNALKCCVGPRDDVRPQRHWRRYQLLHQETHRRVGCAGHRGGHRSNDAEGERRLRGPAIGSL